MRRTLATAMAVAVTLALSLPVSAFQSPESVSDDDPRIFTFFFGPRPEVGKEKAGLEAAVMRILAVLKEYLQSGAADDPGLEPPVFPTQPTPQS